MQRPQQPLVAPGLPLPGDGSFFSALLTDEEQKKKKEAAEKQQKLAAQKLAMQQQAAKMKLQQQSGNKRPAPTIATSKLFAIDDDDEEKQAAELAAAAKRYRPTAPGRAQMGAAPLPAAAPAPAAAAPSPAVQTPPPLPAHVMQTPQPPPVPYTPHTPHVAFVPSSAPLYPPPSHMPAPPAAYQMQPPPLPPPPVLASASSPLPPTDPAVLKAIHNLAAFVAKQGRSFEATVKSKSEHDPKFRFLFEPDSDDYRYYQQCLAREEAARAAVAQDLPSAPAIPPVPAPTPVPVPVPAASPASASATPAAPRRPRLSSMFSDSTPAAAAAPAASVALSSDGPPPLPSAPSSFAVPAEPASAPTTTTAAGRVRKSRFSDAPSADSAAADAPPSAPLSHSLAAAFSPASSSAPAGFSAALAAAQKLSASMNGGQATPAAPLDPDSIADDLDFADGAEAQKASKERSARKHHIGDFLPANEMRRFAAQARGSEMEDDDGDPTKLSATNVGHKMLSKMGWEEGTGLGRKRSGRAVPVKADMRAPMLGVGALGAGEVEADDDPFTLYKKRMAASYKYRPNPFNNPRKAYWDDSTMNRGATDKVAAIPAPLPPAPSSSAAPPS